MDTNDSNLALLSKLVVNLLDYNNAIDAEWRRLQSNNEALEEIINKLNNNVDTLYYKTQEATEFHVLHFLKKFFEDSLEKAMNYKEK